MRSIVISGSKRYKDEIAEFASNLRNLGALVFEPNFKEPMDEAYQIHSPHITKVLFKGLTFEHFDWIRKADMCLIFNHDNYVGVSTTMEMAYASALSKPIIALNPETGDPCRDALVDIIASTPEEVVKLL